MIKLSSISTLWSNTYAVIVRFPVQFLISVFAVIVWWLAIDAPAGDQVSNLYKLLALSNLAFCLTLSADLFSESRSLNTVKQWILRISGLLFCVLLYFVLSPQWHQTDLYRFALFILAGHLLVSSAPFFKKQQIHAFWHYNKFLFLRFLTAVLYSGVLYVGLIIALFSIESLFKVNIPENLYFQLFAIIAAGFNSLFFLAGIPNNIEFFEQDDSYPTGLKIFTQYVLIPLLSIYLAILLLYEFKILIDQELPDGMVSILINGYAVFGILSYLLVFPIRGQKGNEWMRVFVKLFFILMVPLLILLFLAIWVRVSDYGITEPRYFLMLLSCWLLGITAYFLINRQPNIQVIPISLCIMALVSIFGPQSASQVAKSSQLSRYKKLGNDENAEKEKASIINYVVTNHGLTSLQSLINADLAIIQENIEQKDSTFTYGYKTKNRLRDTAFSLLEVKPWLDATSFNFINMELADKVINISGYDYLINLQTHEPMNVPLNSQKEIRIEFMNNKDIVKVNIGQSDNATINLNPFFQSLRKITMDAEYDVYKTTYNSILLPDSLLQLNTESDQHKLTFVFKSISIPQDSLNAKANHLYNSFDVVLLIKEKD